MLVLPITFNLRRPQNLIITSTLLTMEDSNQIDKSGHENLEWSLRRAELAKADTYDKRTEHLNEDGSAVFINRLILEDSPYLLQHAHNPVNWYPWGNEAFKVARMENKPLFLSIGYSTCHWCHVMEVESFDNVQVAKLLNRHFISIKMDREQYPDIDDYYMTGVQLISGHGGWPMSNFLLQDGKPFFGATYFPATSFIDLLENIVEAWQEKRSEVESGAKGVHETIGRLLTSEQNRQTVSANVQSDVLKSLYQREDTTYGGMAGAPKFPQEPLLMLVLDQVIRQQDEVAAGYLNRALTGMGNGGIHDQVGGGFHRYSVDEEWLVPHFEKMLYNQSQLGMLYTDGFRITGNATFRRIAIRLFDYVLRDMQLDEGGFYSATDADSEGREGTFFLWDPIQFKELLGEQDARFFIKIFRVTSGGNFEGATILNLDKPLEAISTRHAEDVVARIDNALLRLYEAREERVHPLRDDKLIVAWCAAMATALVHSAEVLHIPGYLDAARRAVTVMMTHNRRSDGRLWRIYLNGKVSIPAQLEDYGNLIQGLIALFDATTELHWLKHAAELAEVMIQDFYDEPLTAFYSGPTHQTGPELLRSTSATDDAMLSAVGLSLFDLWELADRSALLDDPMRDKRYKRIVQVCLSKLAADINTNALSYSSLLRLLTRIESGSRASVQFAAGGLVRIAVNKQADRDGQITNLTVKINCTAPWHLVAPTAVESVFTSLAIKLDPEDKVWSLGSVHYPSPHAELNLPIAGSGSPESTAIYQGQIEIRAELLGQSQSTGSANCVRVQLQLQACSDQQCLSPQILKFVV